MVAVSDRMRRRMNCGPDTSIVRQVVHFDGVVDLSCQFGHAIVDIRNLMMHELLDVGLHQSTGLREDAQKAASILRSRIVELIQSHLELRILFNIGLEGLGVLGENVDREITGLGIPESLILGIGHELHEFPGRRFALFAAGAESPQRAAAHGHAADVISIDVREIADADFEGTAHVGHKGLERCGGLDIK